MPIKLKTIFNDVELAEIKQLMISKAEQEQLHAKACEDFTNMDAFLETPAEEENAVLLAMLAEKGVAWSQVHDEMYGLTDYYRA